MNCGAIAFIRAIEHRGRTYRFRRCFFRRFAYKEWYMHGDMEILEAIEQVLNFDWVSEKKKELYRAVKDQIHAKSEGMRK